MVTPLGCFHEPLPLARGVPRFPMGSPVRWRTYPAIAEATRTGFVVQTTSATTGLASHFLADDAPSVFVVFAVFVHAVTLRRPISILVDNRRSVNQGLWPMGANSRTGQVIVAGYFHLQRSGSTPRHVRNETSLPESDKMQARTPLSQPATQGPLRSHPSGEGAFWGGTPSAPRLPFCKTLSGL